MNKFISKIKLLWFFAKALFGARLEGIDTPIDSQTQEVKDPTSWGKYQLQRFLELYNVNAEDKINYTNTKADFESNYKHLDDPENERFDNVTEVVGLKYEEDGKTPLNAAEVFDMTYEEYELYKKAIIPRAEHKTIEYKEIEEFLNTCRTT